MRHRFELDGEVRVLEAVRRDGVLVLAVKGAESREYPYRSLPDGRLLLEVGGRTVEAVTASEGAAVWVFMDGRSWKVEDADQAPGRRVRRGRDDLGDVTPPMPAVVVHVLVATGDEVVRGQGLVVVSAMKMETTLVSPRDGVVAALRTEVGDRVAPGDVLVDVSPAAETGGGEEAVDDG